MDVQEWKTGVYCWLNLIDGKRYVGSSGLSLRKRRNLHRSHLRRNCHSNQYFQRAWNKYGEEAFEFIVLEGCEPAVCVEREQHWMNHYKSADRRFGYNLAEKAGSVLGIKRSDEFKAKARAANLGRKDSPERIAKTADANRGRKLNTEQLAKLSAAQRKRYESAEEREKTAAAVRESRTPEVCEKISAGLQKHYESPEARTRASERGRKCNGSDEARARQGVISKTFWDDSVHREKRIAAMRAVSKNPETLAKKSAAMKGRHYSEATRHKMSVAQQKRYESPETRERLAEHCRRLSASPEIRAKMSEIRRKDWADPEVRARRVAGLKAAWERRKSLLVTEQAKVDE